MDLRQLRAVLAVADHLHFGRAAKDLGTSQPQLSHLVRDIETELGVSLFQRDTRNVALTSAGASFTEQVRQVLRRLDSASELARAMGRGDAGALTVGTVGSALAAPLPRLLRAFRERHPAITITFRQMSTAEQARLLLDGGLDLGVLRPPLPEPFATELALIPIARESVLALLPPDHPHVERHTIALRELRDDRFIRNPRGLGSGLHEAITTACRAAGFVPNVILETAGMDAVVALVAAGYGTAIVPATVARTAPAQVAAVPFRPVISPLDLALATRRPANSAPAERFAALAKDLGVQVIP